MTKHRTKPQATDTKRPELQRKPVSGPELLSGALDVVLREMARRRQRELGEMLRRHETLSAESEQ
jgi:hypothetical protein